MPREMTPEECRTAFLDYLEFMVNYWDNLAHKSRREAIEGVVFSVLVAIDGEASGIPSLELLTSPHEDHRMDCESQGEDWWPTFLDLSDGELHSRWAKR